MGVLVFVFDVEIRRTFVCDGCFQEVKGIVGHGFVFKKHIRVVVCLER